MSKIQKEHKIIESILQDERYKTQVLVRQDMIQVARMFLSDTMENIALVPSELEYKYSAEGFTAELWREFLDLPYVQRFTKDTVNDLAKAQAIKAIASGEKLKDGMKALEDSEIRKNKSNSNANFIIMLLPEKEKWQD